MNYNFTDLQQYIEKTSLDNGAILVGFTKIRRVEPVIIFGFPYSDKWFLKFPLTLTKKLGEVYYESKKVQDLVAKELKNEGFSAHYKTILSLYGDFRPLAASAGLGKWGRNGLIVNEKHGSGLLFAAIFTDAPFHIKEDSLNNNPDSHCSDCGQCVESCPGKAFENNTFHTNRCMAYSIRGCSECLKNCTGTLS